MKGIRTGAILITLLLATGACIGVSIAIPALIPVMVPFGCVFLGGVLKVLYNVAKLPDNNTAEHHEEANEVNAAEIICNEPHHPSHHRESSLNILFTYNVYDDETVAHHHVHDSAHHEHLTLS